MHYSFRFNETTTRRNLYQGFLKDWKTTIINTDEGVILTSLKVTFLLAWGSSTIFCKFAATEKKDSVSVQLKWTKTVCSEREENVTQRDPLRIFNAHVKNFNPQVKNSPPSPVKIHWPITKSLPSTRPADTSSWDTPSAVSEKSEHTRSTVAKTNKYQDGSTVA